MRNFLRELLCLAVGSVVLVSAPVMAAPVPDDQRIPVDIRRTTLVVRDVDKSLLLYRDSLGLAVIYDQLIGDGVDENGKAIAPRVRLVLLRANDTFVGVLGLMQPLNQPPAPAPVYAKPDAGRFIVVLNVADLEQRWVRIEATPHIKVDTAPTRIEYPQPGGGAIPVMFSAVWDADGNYIELNRLLGAPAGSTMPVR